MGCRILKAETGEQVLYDSVTMKAFGIVHEDEDIDLQKFLDRLPGDARRFTDKDLEFKYYEWLQDEREAKDADEYENWV